MKQATVLFVFSALFFGCIVPSIHPIYTDKDLVFDGKLVGSWGERADDSWTFTKSDDTTYRLEIKDGKRSGVFVAHLVKLGDTRFLDVYPGDIDDDSLPMQAEMLMPFHLFARVDGIGGELKLAAIDPEALEKLLEAEPAALKHEFVDDALVLTAGTKELQKFLIAHAGDEKLFHKLDAITKMDAEKSETKP